MTVFFRIVIDGVPSGGTVNVTLDLPGSFTAGSDPYYKWDAVNGWQTFPYTNGANTNQVLLTLTDGGAGDADGVANGQIVDPGSPGSTVAVPNVVGLTQANADAAIVGAGLVVGSVITTNSNTVPTGDVISQAPGAGTNVAPGSAVTIVVSLGVSVPVVPVVPVPDVAGLSQVNADAVIVGAGLVVGSVITTNSNTVPTGDVISQAPDAGANVAPGTAVTIVVSLGALVAVSDVAGLSQANAEAAIEGAGLVVGSVITANSDTVPTGDVISQAPDAGTNVAPGTAVTIVVSLGASVPQLTFGSSNGLFGCSVGSGDGPVDPTLPLLVLISVLYLSRRRWMRVWQV